MSDFELPPKKQPKPAVKQSSLPPAPSSQEAPALPDAKETPQSEYNQEELLQIFDNIIFSGEYQETVDIKNRLRIVFRTRTAEEINAIQMHLDQESSNMKLVSTVDNLRSFMTLSASLVSYQGKDLTSMKAEEKTNYIGKLAGPIISLLFSELAKFDRKVMFAIQEGESNF